MKKRIFSLLLTLVVLVGMLPSTVRAAQTEPENTPAAQLELPQGRAEDEAEAPEEEDEASPSSPAEALTPLEVYSDVHPLDAAGSAESTALKELSFTNGSLAPQFDAAVTGYTLTLDDGAEETTISYASANSVFEARAYLNRLRPNAAGYASGDTMPVKAGDTIYVLVGYSGWSGSPSGAKQTLYTITAAAPATPAATWTVTFDAQGGSAVAAQSVLKNTAAAEPDPPEKDGYSFSGWYLEPACKTAWDFSLPVTGDMTLYAGWIEKAGTGAYLSLIHI